MSWGRYVPRPPVPLLAAREWIPLRSPARSYSGGMKIAVAGKGGSGKTTLAATLARLAARQGRDVVAVDGDSNPNLALALGLSEDVANTIPPVPRDVIVDKPLDDGGKTSVLAMPAAEVVRRHGVIAPDGVRLLVMGRVGHAGAG